MKPKVAVITEIPTPYRSPVFDILRHHADVDFDFIYLSKHQRDRPWGDHAHANDVVLDSSQICIRGYHTVYFTRGLEKLLKKKYDLFILGGYAQPAMWKILRHCWKHNIPYVMVTESHLHKRRSGLKNILKRCYLKKVYGRSSANLVMGEKAKAYVRSYDANANAIFSFPNTIDVPKYSKLVQQAKTSAREEKERLGLDAKTVVLFVGMLNRRKGVDLLLEAFSHLHRLHASCALVMVGSGDLETMLKERVKKEGLESCVRFSGFVPPQMLPMYYAMADVFVLPSLDEPFGAVVLEAMASGLPVLATDEVGATNDYMLDQKHGYVVRAGSTELLQESLEQLLSDAALRSRMGQAAFESIQTWTHEKMAQQVLQAVKASMNKVFLIVSFTFLI